MVETEVSASDAAHSKETPQSSAEIPDIILSDGTCSDAVAVHVRYDQGIPNASVTVFLTDLN